ncbi:hypothetical protein [Natronococcus wangiae]|uniref:hypothetical protein n=1 Tax=Natronococcus wangiae TaxID=3068275 RepID=UPI00273D9902|nr:hypothetical protein [Natronococcus sp. AD5]
MEFSHASDASITDQSASLAHMERITLYARENHLEQIRSGQESADGDISEAEAVRRIFDRAAEADRAEAERESIRSEYESKKIRSGPTRIGTRIGPKRIRIAD